MDLPLYEVLWISLTYTDSLCGPASTSLQCTSLRKATKQRLLLKHMPPSLRLTQRHSACWQLDPIDCFPLKCYRKPHRVVLIRLDGFHQKSIYFKLKETLRNTTNKSMRSTDKMRNCHLMEGMATWLILADQINIKDLFKINITLLKNTATVFKRKSLEQLS